MVKELTEGMRLETDLLGSIEIPEDALYGIYTARVLENFQISTRFVPEEFLKNYIGVKRLYAHINFKHNKIDRSKAEAVIDACDTLLAMDSIEFMQHFPIDVIQSGGGTSTNMVVNEVIANIAEVILGGKVGQYKMIHPNDDVNMSQSSNDTFPAVIKITTYFQISRLLKVLEALQTSLISKSKEFKDISKVGRTHIQEALPMTVGNEISAMVRTIEKNFKYIETVQRLLLELPLGATAIGSTQNISTQMRKDLIREISKELEVNFTRPRNYFEATNSSSDFSKISSAIASLANDLIKIGNDLRLLSSGPKAGVAEYKLPEVQAGSSIMPGKVNPSIVEAVTMVCFEVLGKDHTIQIATRSAQLQLQAFSPVIAWSTYDMLDMLSNGISTLTSKCIKGLKINKIVTERNLSSSMALATSYSEKLGYDKVAKLVKEAQKKDLSIIGLLEAELLKKN